MAAAAAGAAALGGPCPNPTNDGPRLRSPPGKGKPVALADITNTGRRNATRSLSVADVVKENAKLVQLVNEKTRILELSGVEMQKLRFALQVLRQQNLQLAQANSQMLAELNLGKDRLKALQHQLSCTAAVLNVKNSELEKKNKAADQRQKEQYQEPPNDITTKRGRNKRKSESIDCIKDNSVMQDHCRPKLQPAISLDDEGPRKPVRRSTRLKPGCCEVTEISSSKLPEDDVAPSSPSSFISQKQHGPTTGNDTIFEINEQPLKDANSKEIQEASSSLPGIEVHQIGYTTSSTKCSHPAEMQSSRPFDIVEPPKALEDVDNKRGASKEKLKIGKDPATAIENVNAKCDPSSREPLHHDEKRKCQRRKSARLSSVLSENTMSTSETLQEDVISSLPHSSSNSSMEQTMNQKQADRRSSTKALEGQVAGRRSLRRAAEKFVSYKEIPINVKMRRP